MLAYRDRHRNEKMKGRQHEGRMETRKKKIKSRKEADPHKNKNERVK